MTSALVSQPRLFFVAPMMMKRLFGPPLSLARTPVEILSGRESYWDSNDRSQKLNSRKPFLHFWMR